MSATNLCKISQNDTDWHCSECGISGMGRTSKYPLSCPGRRRHHKPKPMVTPAEILEADLKLLVEERDALNSKIAYVEDVIRRISV